MATVYSLVCWGGSAGKSVTVSSSTDYVTLTNHGLRNATGVAFTSGTLPTVAGTALALNTTYYAKSISSSTFELYYDSSLTSKIDFTSTGSSLIMKSAYYLGLSDKSRWTTGGTERIYDGLVSWNSGRSAASVFDEEICEIGEGFIEYNSAAFTINIPSAKATITTLVNGTRSGGYHGGSIGTLGVGVGFVYRSTATSANVTITGYRKVLDGFTVLGVSNSVTGVYVTGALCGLTRMIVTSTGTNAGSHGVYIAGSLSYLEYSVVYGFYRQLYYQAGVYGIRVSNCLLSGGTVGLSGTASSSQYGYFYNVISIGNTTNWPTQPSGIEGATNNAGLSTDTPWVTSGGTSFSLATTDFANYASLDFTPANVSSPQVENGTSYYGSLDSDITGLKLPSYPGSNYNTAVTAGSFVTGLSYTIASVGTTDFTAIGASANTVGVTFKATGAGTGTGTATLNAKIDIGAYEFDLGYGAWPATFTLTIDNVVVGSSIQLEKSDGTLIEFRTADSTSEVFAVSASLGVITVKIRKGSSGTKYQPYETQTTAFDGSASIYVSQVADTIAA